MQQAKQDSSSTKLYKSTFTTLLSVSTHRLQSSSFLGLPYRILNITHKKEPLWSLWVQRCFLQFDIELPSDMHEIVLQLCAQAQGYWQGSASAPAEGLKEGPRPAACLGTKVPFGGPYIIRVPYYIGDPKRDLHVEKLPTYRTEGKKQEGSVSQAS